MAKNNPLTICNIKQIPTRDPKFHKVEILEGLGKSIKELLTIFNKLCVFRLCFTLGSNIIFRGYSNY